MQKIKFFYDNKIEDLESEINEFLETDKPDIIEHKLIHLTSNDDNPHRVFLCCSIVYTETVKPDHLSNKVADLKNQLRYHTDMDNKQIMQPQLFVQSLHFQQSLII